MSGTRQKNYFQLLETQIGSGLVVRHVVVPSLGELKELGFLSGLDILKFLVLGGADVVLLPLSFLSQELFELGAALPSLGVVALLFALATVLLEQSQKVKHLRVRLNVSNAPGSRHLLLVTCGIVLLLHVLLFRGVIGVHNFAFNTLHQGNEVVEGDGALILESVDELSNFFRVPLQRAHDRFKVSRRDLAGLLLVEQVEDLAQVLNLVICELLGVLLLRRLLHMGVIPRDLRSTLLQLV